MATNKEKTIIVTGANCGLGYSSACRLCKDGYDVILACRSKEKAETAVTQIKKTIAQASVSYLLLDLCDFTSVRSFVDEFRKLDKHLYALVNNAGIVMVFGDNDRKTTSDGLELTMASNYFGHFLLTNLLLQELKDGAQRFGEARVVSVTSSLHDPELAKSSLRGKKFDIKELEFDNLNMEKEGTYCGIQAYKNSKCAIIMFTFELAKKLEGTGVTAVSLCPGFIPTTNLSRNTSYIGQIFIRYFLPTISKLSGKNFVSTLEQGTERIVGQTTEEGMKGVTAKFYRDGVEAEPRGDTLDEDKWKKLWDLTENIVGLKTTEL